LAAVNATARAVRGPRGLKHPFRILMVVAATEYKLKYADSWLGYVWSVIKPLALFTLLYLVFGRIFKLGDVSEYYAVGLLIGIVLFTFFDDASSLGMTSIVANESLVRRLAFPRAIVPASATVTAAITFAVNAVVVAGFIGLKGITPQLDWLLIPLLLLELYVFVLGVAFVLSTLYVFLRDIGQVWELGLLLVFYASPIIYPIGFLPPWARDLAFVNPFTQVLQDIRALVLYPDVAGNKVTAGDALVGGRAIPIAVALGTFAFGLLLLRRHEARFAERV
jgi:ABC-2 type transport system permease protein